MIVIIQTKSKEESSCEGLRKQTLGQCFCLAGRENISTTNI